MSIEPLRSVVAALVTPVPVYLTYGDMPRPTTAHLTMRIATDTDRGFPQPASATSMTQIRQMRVQIDGYRTAGVAAVRRVALMLRSEDSRVAVLAIQGVSDVQDTTTWWQTAHEPRAMVEVRMGYLQTESSATLSLPVERIDLHIESEESSIVIEDVAPIP